MHHVLGIGGGIVHGHDALGHLARCRLKHCVKEGAGNGVLLQVQARLPTLGLNLIALELGEVLLARLVRGKAGGEGGRGVCV